MHLRLSPPNTLPASDARVRVLISSDWFEIEDAELFNPVTDLHV